MRSFEFTLKDADRGIDWDLVVFYVDHPASREGAAHFVLSHVDVISGTAWACDGNDEGFPIDVSGSASRKLATWVESRYSDEIASAIDARIFSEANEPQYAY